jgi:phenylalanine-4-hydroxylase
MLPNRKRPTTQVYNDYTPDDHAVWQLLYQRQLRLLNDYASKAYLKALDAVAVRAQAIPEFSVLNKSLMAATGWKIQVVEGHVPPALFFNLLSQKIFPATCWLRTKEELDYIEEPDMFHDVFGHVPLLMQTDYAQFMHSFGTMALEWAAYPEITTILSRLYWFTIEFGLLKQDEEHVIYGAGILSSPGETLHAMSTTPRVLPFVLEQVIQTDFRTDVMQNLYFVIPSFQSLNQAMDTLHLLLKQQLVSVTSAELV